MKRLGIGRLKTGIRWTETDQLLMASLGFSVAMILGRYLYSGSSAFFFLCWNLFLAWLPYAIVRWMESRKWMLRSRAGMFIGFSAWLLFLPNSFYILTDLFHLHGLLSIGKWYDLTLIVSCAWNGLLLGLLAVRHMQRILFPQASPGHSWIFLFPLMLLNGLGVYLGRYLRFNSWDILSNPFELAGDILHMALHPLRNLPEWAMIGFFSLFMTLVYQTISHLSSEFAKENSRSENA